MLRTKQLRAAGIAVVITLVLVVISSSGTAAPLRVVATFSVIADMAEHVGGGRVDVTSIVPIGGDPHTWEPTPREARNLAAADVLLYNGLGLELWVDRLIRSAARPDLPVIILSEGLEPIPGASFGAHVHEEGDPHFWLNVQYGMHYVERIRDAFVELDRWIEETVAQIPEDHRKLVTYHDAFGYLAERYGLTISGFLVVNPDREPSSREMAEISRQLADYARPVIFVEPQISTGHRYAEAVASEVGGRVGLLYSDSLTEEVPTYVDMMRFNATQLLEALQ